MAKIDQLESELSKLQERARKLRAQKAKEENRVFANIGKLYVQLQQQLDDALSLEKIEEQLTAEIKDLKNHTESKNTDNNDNPVEKN